MFISQLVQKFLQRILLKNAMHQVYGFSGLIAGLFVPFALLSSPMVNAATKVAFIADQGVGSGARAVLSLIASENVDIVLIQGDLGYEPNSALEWDQNLTNALGRDFPVLSLAGNHENFEWPLYQRLIEQRLERAAGISCDGEVGVKASCKFENLHVVQVAQGIIRVAGIKSDDNYSDFIRSSFQNDDSLWKVCAWHKNQRAMQAYSKSNETGWDIYDACLDKGAMVAMGHAHTYSRTHLMKDFRTQQMAHQGSVMTLKPGSSFAVVSGLGGRDIKSQKNNGDWFASVYTQTQGATHGALFCTLETNTADCYFKAINGAIPDQFRLIRGSASRQRPEGGSCIQRTPTVSTSRVSLVNELTNPVIQAPGKRSR